MAQSQYATIAELESLAITKAAGDRFGAVAMNAQLQAASSIADGYLISQFTLPLETDPQGWDMSLTSAVSNIAAYLLYNQFGFSPMAPGDDLVVKRYDDAIAWLGLVRDKKIFPPFVDSAGSPEAFEGGPDVITATTRGYSERGVFPGSFPRPQVGPFSDD